MEKTINGTRPLNKRFEEPEVVAAINRLLDRIDALENTVETLNQLVQQGPGFTAMVTDIVDETVKKAAASGVSIDDRVKNVLLLAGRVTEDQTVALLGKALDLAQEAPGFMAMVTDMFDEQMQQAAAHGIDVDARLKGMLSLVNKITEPDTLNALAHVLDAEAVQTVGLLGTALAESQTREIQPLGPIALMRKMRDPDVQRATGFLLNIAKSLGQGLKK